MNDYIKGKIDALEEVAEIMPEVIYTDVYRDLVEELPTEEISPAYIIGELERYGLRARTELLGGGLVGVWIDLKQNHYGLVTNGYGLGVYDTNQIEYDRLRFDDLAEEMTIANKLKLMATVLNYYGQPNN